MLDTDSLGLGGTRGPSPHSALAPPLTPSLILSPVTMIAIGDGFMGDKGLIQEAGALWRKRGLEDQFGSTGRAYSRHRGKADILFCDGHVESPTLNSLFSDTSARLLSRWNRDNQPHLDRLGQ